MTSAVVAQWTGTVERADRVNASGVNVAILAVAIVASFGTFVNVATFGLPEGIDIELVTIQTFTMERSLVVDTFGIDNTTAVVDQTLVNISTVVAVSRIPVITVTDKGSDRVGASCVLMTVVRLVVTFVIVFADNRIRRRLVESRLAFAVVRSKHYTLY